MWQEKSSSKPKIMGFSIQVHKTEMMESAHVDPRDSPQGRRGSRRVKHQLLIFQPRIFNYGTCATLKEPEIVKCCPWCWRHRRADGLIEPEGVGMSSTWSGGKKKEMCRLLSLLIYKMSANHEAWRDFYGIWVVKSVWNSKMFQLWWL